MFPACILRVPKWLFRLSRENSIDITYRKVIGKEFKRVFYSFLQKSEKKTPKLVYDVRSKIRRGLVVECAEGNAHSLSSACHVTCCCCLETSLVSPVLLISES